MRNLALWEGERKKIVNGKAYSIWVLQRIAESKGFFSSITPYKDRSALWIPINKSITGTETALLLGCWGWLAAWLALKGEMSLLWQQGLAGCLLGMEEAGQKAGYQMVISVGLGEAGNSWKWEKLHLASRLKSWFYSGVRTDPGWSREGSNDSLLGQGCWIWWSGEVLPTLRSLEICVEESANRFESTMCKVFAALLVSCSCISQTALPTIIIRFLGFAELSLSSFQAQSSRDVIARGSSKKRIIGCSLWSHTTAFHLSIFLPFLFWKG